MVSLSCECERSQEIKTANGTLYTTANIGDLKFGANEEANPPKDVFQPKDKIYAVVKIANAGSGSKYKLKFRLLIDDVKGIKSGHLITENEGEKEGSGSTWFEFSRRDGFPVGRYKAEVVLSDESGTTEIDRKESTFNITDNITK